MKLETIPPNPVMDCLCPLEVSSTVNFHVEEIVVLPAPDTGAVYELRLYVPSEDVT
jgi:hypothetical protein